MKIALLAARLPPACDGVGDHADRLARALAERGHDVVAVSAGDAAPATTYRIESVGSHWGFPQAARAAAALWALRPDAAVVEYTPFLYGARSPAAIAFLLAARWARIRSVIIVHEAFYAPGTDAVGIAWKASLLNLRDCWTLAAADCIAVPSAARAEELARRLPLLRERLQVVPIGANVEAPPMYRREPVRPASIVSFGVVSPRRRLERAIDAVAKLTAAGRDVHLDVIGRVYDADYAAAMAERARARGIGDRVVFRGELAPAALSAAFGEATVALHGAREGAIASSGSLLALLAHGVPVVALRTPHDDDVFAGALHYADDNDSAVVAALRALIDEPQAAESLVMAGVARWRSQFGWDRVADGLLEGLQNGESRVRVATV